MLLGERWLGLVLDLRLTRVRLSLPARRILFRPSLVVSVGILAFRALLGHAEPPEVRDACGPGNQRAGLRPKNPARRELASHGGVTPFPAHEAQRGSLSN